MSSILDSLCEDRPADYLKMRKQSFDVPAIKEVRKYLFANGYTNRSADWDRHLDLAVDMLDELVRLKSKMGESLQLVEQNEINVDDLKAVGLQVKEQKPGQPLTTGKDEKDDESEVIPPSAAIVAPTATPPEEEVPQSVIDATATSEEEPGVIALCNALRKVHQKHGKSDRPAPVAGEEAPNEDLTHAESFEEMGSSDYRKLMLEARSGKRS